MRKVFIDLGCCDGDTIRTFLFRDSTVETRKGNAFKLRDDATEYEIYGFDGHDWGKKWDPLKEKGCKLFNKVAWTHNGVVKWRKCQSKYCRSVDGFNWSGNVRASIIEVPCFDFAEWLNELFTPEDYIVLKMDIEGSEIALLSSLHQHGLLGMIKELYIEYHDNVLLQQTDDANFWRENLPKFVPYVVEWKP